jgi:hypothetical protein
LTTLLARSQNLQSNRSATTKGFGFALRTPYRVDKGAPTEVRALLTTANSELSVGASCTESRFTSVRGGIPAPLALLRGGVHLSCVSSSIYAAWTSIGTACTAGTRATFTTSGTTTGPAASAAARASARASATTTLGYSTGDTESWRVRLPSRISLHHSCLSSGENSTLKKFVPRRGR